MIYLSLINYFNQILYLFYILTVVYLLIYFMLLSKSITLFNLSI